jgi:hypothetical protein
MGSCSDELVFPNNALVAVDLAFDAVLRFRETANDLEEFVSGVVLTPIW